MQYVSLVEGPTFCVWSALREVFEFTHPEDVMLDRLI